MNQGLKIFSKTLWLASLLIAATVYRETQASAEELPQQAFGSLVTLDQAIEKAFASEPRLKQALARVAKERALHEESGRELLPKFKVELREALATGDETLLTNFRVTLEEPIFQGGKLASQRKRRGLILKKSELSLEETKLDVTREIETLYARVSAENELTRLAQEKVRALSGHLEKQKKLLGEKMITPRDLLHVKTLYEEATHELVSHKETYDYLWVVLKEIVGVSEREELLLEALPNLKELEPVESYLERTRENHPLYKAKELALQEKRHEKRELESECFPHLTLAAEWERARDVYLDTNRFLVGVKGTWNVWDFGRTSALLKAKQGELEETTWGMEARILEHEREVKRLVHEARALREGIKFSEAQVSEAREAYKNEKARELAGEVGNALEAFLALTRAKLDLIQKAAEYRITLAELEWRMGVAP